MPRNRSQTVEETVEVTKADVAEIPAEGTTETPKRTRRTPVYSTPENVVALDELPESAKRVYSGGGGGIGRKMYFHNLLSTLIVEKPENHGKWVPIATYPTSTGAVQAKTALMKRERQIPEGDWEFDFRKVRNEETGKLQSVLYGKYSALIEGDEE